MNYLLILLPLTLSSCALLPPPPPTQTAAAQAQWQLHQSQLSALTQWQLGGSISITDNEDNWRARVYWQQELSDYQMRFNAPLGQGALLLQGHNHQVTLRTADNKVFQADNPDTLIAKVLKLDLPVSGLHFWIRGLPTPTSVPKQLNLNDNGYLHSLHQDGWQIEYLSYFDEQDIQLPKQIYLENHRFQVKMVISHWQRQLSPTINQPEV